MAVCLECRKQSGLLLAWLTAAALPISARVPLHMRSLYPAIRAATKETSSQAVKMFVEASIPLPLGSCVCMVFLHYASRHYSAE